MCPHPKMLNPRIPDKINITPKCLAIPRESLNSKRGTRLKRWNPICFWGFLKGIEKCRENGFLSDFAIFYPKMLPNVSPLFGVGKQWGNKITNINKNAKKS